MLIKYVTNTYEITDKYRSILLDVKEAKVKIEPSSDGSTSLVLFEKKRNPYRFSVQNGTLTVEPTKTKWYNSLKVGIDHSRITVRVPKSTLDAITVKATVGDVDISSVNCTGAIDVQTNTGKVSASDISSRAFSSKGNTGSIALTNVTATETVYVKRNTGKVSLNDCTSPEISIKTNTGRVCGRLPSSIAFAVQSNTGKIQVPKPPIGEAISGRCEIKTNTGRVQFE